MGGFVKKNFPCHFPRLAGKPNGVKMKYRVGFVGMGKSDTSKRAFRFCMNRNIVKKSSYCFCPPMLCKNWQ
jgi:hypothetical protein